MYIGVWNAVIRHNAAARGHSYDKIKKLFIGSGKYYHGQ